MFKIHSFLMNDKEKKQKIKDDMKRLIITDLEMSIIGNEHIINGSIEYMKCKGEPVDFVLNSTLPLFNAYLSYKGEATVPEIDIVNGIMENEFLFKFQYIVKAKNIIFTIKDNKVVGEITFEFKGDKNV